MPKLGIPLLSQHEKFYIKTILYYYLLVKGLLLLWMGRLQLYNRSFLAVHFVDTLYISSESESFIIILGNLYYRVY